MCLANAVLNEKQNSTIGYIYKKPESLEKYIEAFAGTETRVIVGPTVIECKGYNGQPHSFLQAEGVSSCRSRKTILCRFCFWKVSEEDGSQLMCFECKRYNLAGEDDQKTEQKMRDFLKMKRVNVPTAATYTQVLQLFQMRMSMTFSQRTLKR
jgi:hypothetical protein